ncbi:hypothetical protein EI555_020286 [Monodon monoceros]|uniref:Uncharacterized protein n=1 Tax=Monodon monoceros TaxID=40151 RepID=A0A4U1F706_MONMO|nr:hypothetical protein EI555_020286 [Monodon monoceros]
MPESQPRKTKTQ